MLNIKAIYAHQLFNKDILLMKRESKDRHHFSFGEYYDEILLNGYPIEIQSHMLPIHQIIVFSLITKPYENDNRRSKKDKNRRLSAQSGVFARKAAGGKSLVQIPVQGRERALVQGKHRA